MEFYTSFCEKRPMRLCKATRKFAYESLYEHRYGLETRANYAVSIDGAEIRVIFPILLRRRRFWKV